MGVAVARDDSIEDVDEAAGSGDGLDWFQWPVARVQLVPDEADGAGDVGGGPVDVAGGFLGRVRVRGGGVGVEVAEDVVDALGELAEGVVDGIRGTGEGVEVVEEMVVVEEHPEDGAVQVPALEDLLPGRGTSEDVWAVVLWRHAMY